MNIEEALQALGDTHEAVYLTIKSKGVTGKPRSPCNCPVARYLRQEVQSNTISVGTGDAGDNTCTAMLPFAVKRFIALFDLENMYRDLISQEGDIT